MGNLSVAQAATGGLVENCFYVFFQWLPLDPIDRHIPEFFGVFRLVADLANLPVRPITEIKSRSCPEVVPPFPARGPGE
jgi:hypothetical protein